MCLPSQLVYSSCLRWGTYVLHKPTLVPASGLTPSPSFLRWILQVPFTLSCGTPGRLRWVTTNIARFDPSIDWPTDLDCQFEWNKALKTYDGKQAHAANSIQRRGSSAAGAVCRGCWQRCRTGLQCATMRISVHDW